MRFTLTALGLVAASAFAATAQDAPTIADTDGDGFYSLTEMQATFPDLTAETYATLDTSADGKLDMDEVTAALAAGTLMAPG